MLYRKFCLFIELNRAVAQQQKKYVSEKHETQLKFHLTSFDTTEIQSNVKQKIQLKQKPIRVQYIYAPPARIPS